MIHDLKDSRQTQTIRVRAFNCGQRTLIMGCAKGRRHCTLARNNSNIDDRERFRIYPLVTYITRMPINCIATRNDVANACLRTHLNDVMLKWHMRS